MQSIYHLPFTSCRFLLNNIRRIRLYLTTCSTQLLVQTMVISRLDYCNSLRASLPAYAIQPLQLIQNAAARLVFNPPKFSHIMPLLRSLQWLPVAARIKFKVLTLAYAAANKTAPHYQQDIIQLDHPALLPQAALAQDATGSHSSQLRSFSTLTPQWWKNWFLPAHFPPQLKDSPLHSVPRLLFGSSLIYCPFSYLFSYLALNSMCLGIVVYGTLTCSTQLVYLTYIHDLSSKSM